MQNKMEYLEHLNLTTPSLLFSAISLILLAYTNRFLSYASVVRNLKEKYENDPENDPTSLAQIRNFVKRLKLIRAMQMLGAGSLLFCISAMFFIYIQMDVIAHVIFGVGMLMLAASLILCIIEIQISTEALGLHLQSIRQRQKNKDPFANSSFRRQASRREGETLGEQNMRKQQEKHRQEKKERERTAKEQREQKPKQKEGNNGNSNGNNGNGNGNRQQAEKQQPKPTKEDTKPTRQQERTEEAITTDQPERRETSPSEESATGGDRRRRRRGQRPTPTTDESASAPAPEALLDKPIEPSTPEA